MAQTTTPTRRSRKTRRQVPTGVVHIHASFNNTIITVADPQGNVLAQASSGSAGFKGSRKSTPYASSMAASRVAERAKNYGMDSVSILVRGVGSGRESSIRSIQAAGITVRSIKDITPIPHNGCRPRKPRRV
jgi:small subunit ribosomal protein S11